MGRRYGFNDTKQTVQMSQNQVSSMSFFLHSSDIFIVVKIICLENYHPLECSSKEKWRKMEKFVSNEIG